MQAAPLHGNSGQGSSGAGGDSGGSGVAPFADSINPQALFPHEAFQDVLAELAQAKISDREGATLITGAVITRQSSLPIVSHLISAPFLLFSKMRFAIHGVTVSTRSPNKFKTRFTLSQDFGEVSRDAVTRSVTTIPGEIAPTITDVSFTSSIKASVK